MKNRFGMEIRAATGAEALGVSELLAMAGHDIPPRVLAERLDAIHRSAGAASIAVEWGPPSGLVVLHWFPTLGADRPTAQIVTLFVGPDSRRRGIGRMLLKAASQAARVAGCGALEFSVAADDFSVSAFCRATGFIEAGSRFTRPLRKGG
ncbi:MAG: GNAT family N-acetyltransferase [Rhodospirillales bacterium]